MRLSLRRKLFEEQRAQREDMRAQMRGKMAEVLSPERPVVCTLFSARGCGNWGARGVRQ